MKIIHHEQNGVLHVTLQGKFTFADHEEFRMVLEQIEHPQVKQIAINVKGVEFMDSAGMGMLLLARDESAKHNKGLSLAGAQGQVKKMFDLANFQNFFTMI